MWPDWSSNQQPLDSQSDLLPTALSGPVKYVQIETFPIQGDLFVFWVSIFTIELYNNLTG